MPTPLIELGAGSLLIYGIAQLFGFAGMVSGLESQTIPQMRNKFRVLVVSDLLDAVHFAIMLSAGIYAAWGGLLSMSIATGRALFFYFLTDPQTGHPRLTQKKRSLIGLSFWAIGVLFLFTGFGFCLPIVNIHAFLAGETKAIGLSLPLMASLCGSLCDTMPRTRYCRPISIIGAGLNIVYNLFFSGSISHLLGESAGISIIIRQLIRQDIRHRDDLGAPLSFKERACSYITLMKNPSLPETPYGLFFTKKRD